MLSEATDIHRTMLIAGDAYAIVGVDDDGPYATSEDPRQVVTIHDPIRQARVRAAAKFFAETVLPRLTSDRAIVESTDLSLMELPEAAF